MTERIILPKTYYLVCGVLLILLVLTIVAAEFDFGVFSPVIAVGIATIKAVLIVLYFMHVLYAIPLVRLAAFASIIWLAIAGILTFADYLTRGWEEQRTGRSPVFAVPFETNPSILRQTQLGQE